MAPAAVCSLPGLSGRGRLKSKFPRQHTTKRYTRIPQRLTAHANRFATTLSADCQKVLPRGIGKVHRIPPVGLKCVSEKRRREMTALLGGEQGRRRPV